MKDKIIFLDIDGVVNTLMIYNENPDNKYKIKKDFYFDLCSPSDFRVSNLQAVTWLNKLCKETKAEIVIDSTWRGRNEDASIAAQSLYNSGLDRNIKILGATKWLGRCDDEILNYIKEHFSDEVSFIAIDDDSYDMTKILDRLVKCNTYVGFTFNEYRLALEKLKN